MIRLLAEHGADINRPGGETWRGNVPLRTPYQHAVLCGRTDLAETLASTEVADVDRAIAALARGKRPDVALPDRLDVDAQEVVILAVTSIRSSTRSVPTSAAWSAAHRCCH